MILAWLFWLLLLTPGACLFARLRPKDTAASGFEAIAVGYALSFSVVAPLCIAAYALELPLWTLCAGIVIAVGASLVWLTGWLREHWRELIPNGPYSAAAVLIAFLLLHASALGGHVTNDADFHLARIRFLYDHGLSNADPITGTGFSHTYHTNILHALIAAGAKLTGIDPIVFWQGTLPWSKLVSACSVAMLCLRLGGNTLGAWTVGLFELGADLRVDWDLYPNHLAPFWLMPIGLASCIGLFATSHRRYHALLLGLTGLLLALVHGLYAGYFVVLAAIMLGALLVYQVARDRRRARSALQAAVLGAMLLTVPAPFLYVARYTHVPQQANFDYQGGSPTPRAPKANRWTKALRADNSGTFRLSHRRLLGGPEEQALTAAALVVLLVRRRFFEVVAASAALGSCLALLAVPELARLAVRALGAAWMLERLLDVVFVQQIAIVSAGLIPSIAASRWASFVSGLVPLVVAAVGALLASGGFSNTSWNKVEKSLSMIRALQVLEARLPKEYELDQALLEQIPAGSVVLTHPMAARQLRKLSDVYFVRASRNHTGVDDLKDRTVAMSKLMRAKSLTDEVRAILAEQGIRYAVQKSQHKIKWLDKQPVVGGASTIKLIDLQASHQASQSP